MKKETKKSKTEFSGTAVGALIENLESQFRVFGEKLGTLEDKLDSTMGMVAKNREDITMLNIKTDGIKNDINKLSGKFVQIEEDIRVIKSDVRSIKDDFGKRLTHLEATLK